MAKDTTPTVSFRLPQNLFDRLEEEAKCQGRGVHEHARKLITDVLEDAQREQLQDQVRELGAGLIALREDLAVAIEAVLVGAGRVGRDEARAWVSDNLRTD